MKEMEPWEEVWGTDDENPYEVWAEPYGTIATFYWWKECQKMAMIDIAKGSVKLKRARLAIQAPALVRWALKNVFGPHASFACREEAVKSLREILLQAGVPEEKLNE